MCLQQANADMDNLARHRPKDVTYLPLAWQCVLGCAVSVMAVTL